MNTERKKQREKREKGIVKAKRKQVKWLTEVGMSSGETGR